MSSNDPENALLWRMGISLSLALLSLFASTLARNSLHAIGITLVLVAATSMIFNPLFHHSGLLYILGLPAYATVMIFLAYGNFKRIHEGWRTWRCNLMLLAGTVLIAHSVSLFAYERAWELFSPLEPRHGAARLSLQARAKIFADPWGFKVYVLLPDCRLWTTKDFEPRKIVPDSLFFLPQSGTFIGTSNWVDIAGTFREAVAIQSDGSLWRLFTRNEKNSRITATLLRIGSDNDWTAVTAGTGHFLALKKGGTLWGWGSTYHGELGEESRRLATEPEQIGQDSDWIACMAGESASIAVKRDGSVWRWGYTWIASAHPYQGETILKPTLWKIELSDVADGSWHNGFSLVTRTNGSMWTLRPAEASKSYTRGKPETLTQINTTPVQINGAMDWRTVRSANYFTVALKQDGSLWRDDVMRYNPFGTVSYQDFARASEHSDWVGLTTVYEEYLALASDGTLSCWHPPDWDSQRRLLMLSRKPLWSINIFDAAKP